MIPKKPREIDTPEMITLQIIKNFVFWTKMLKEKTEFLNKTLKMLAEFFGVKIDLKKKNKKNLFTSPGILKTGNRELLIKLLQGSYKYY